MSFTGLDLTNGQRCYVLHYVFMNVFALYNDFLILILIFTHAFREISKNT